MIGWAGEPPNHRGVLPPADHRVSAWVRFLPVRFRFHFPFLFKTRSMFFFSHSPSLTCGSPDQCGPLSAPVCHSVKGNQTSGGSRCMETTGSLNLWTIATCHQDTLTRFLSVPRRTLHSARRCTGGRAYVPPGHPGGYSSRQPSL